MQQATSSELSIGKLLVAKGSQTIGHETNLTRSPIWQARSRPLESEAVVSSVLYGHPFRKIEGRPLTTSDQRLFAHLTTKYLRADCPMDRHVSFSLGEAAMALGHAELGGKQRAMVRSSLARLQSVTIESAVRHPDGHETVLGWRLIDNFLVTTRGGGKGWIVLNEAVAVLLREGSVTFLHAPTWTAICKEDEIAGRLWSFLESENIGRGWRYPLFASGSDSGTALPSIAEMLIIRWAERREVAKRVRTACRVIEKHDSRYRLDLALGAKPGTWTLTCQRGRQSVQRPAAGALPDTLTATWRRVYRSHLPSKAQRRVLNELLERHTSGWIESVLTDASEQGCDPFGALLESDARSSQERLSSARQAEAAWQIEKRDEEVSAEVSLADMIAALRSE
jgi:hypothetical protein